MSVTSWESATAVVVLDEDGISSWTSDEDHRRDRGYQR